MKYIYFWLLLIFLGCNIATMDAQGLAASLGYEYFGKNAGFLGAEYRLDKNDLQNNHGPFNIGVGTYLFSENGKFSLAPEVHVNQTWWHAISTEFSISTKNIKPSAGVSFFNLFRLQFGYSYPFEKSDFKGFYFGVRVNIGRALFYDEIRVF